MKHVSRRQKRPLKHFIIAVIATVAITIPIYLYLSTSYQVHIANVSKATANLPRYGIAAGGSLTELSADKVDAEMADLQAMGVGWVRFDFDWSKIQPDSADHYSWDAYDRLVTSARSHGLQVIGIIVFTPSWARDTACHSGKQCEPRDAQQFANFAGTLSSRYQPQGLHYWEIWNEPNISQFWKPAPNATKYSALLTAAYQSIHTQDPQAIVISGSTSPAATKGPEISPTDFLTRLYDAGAKESFDAVGVHPYTYPVPPSYQSEHAWAQMSEGPKSFRAIMKTHSDDSKKLWLTEFGAPTGGPGATAELNDYNLDEQPWHVTEDLQAHSITEAIRLYKTYDWVGPILIYSYQDAGDTNDTNENFFGLIRADGSHKPAYDALIQAVK